MSRKPIRKTAAREAALPDADVRAAEHPLVLFTSKDGAVTVPTRLERETLWLTQKNMSALFEVGIPAINKHLRNIFQSDELREDSVISILEHTAADGKVYRTQFYNLVKTFQAEGAP